MGGGVSFTVSVMAINFYLYCTKNLHFSHGVTHRYNIPKKKRTKQKIEVPDLGGTFESDDKVKGLIARIIFQDIKSQLPESNMN